MNTCSLFMSNASRHQLDRPPYLPVGTKRGSRITYYVFIFFSLDPLRPVIKGAPPRTRMIYRLCRFALIRWDRLITSCCLLYVPSVVDRTGSLLLLLLLLLGFFLLVPSFLLSPPNVTCITILRSSEDLKMLKTIFNDD